MTQRFSAFRKWTLGFCLLALGVPFLAVDIPPITDLPQQMSQIRLLEEALGNPQGPYRVQWWEPNKLGYLPLWLASHVASPLAAGRLALWMIGATWCIALSALAWHRQRPAAAVALCCMLFFNHALYWGLLNFLVGLPVFIAWVLCLEGRGTSSERRLRPTSWLGRWLVWMTLAALLYGAHILWLLAAIVYLLCFGLRAGFNRHRWLLHSAALAPVLVATAWWYPRLATRGFDSETFWALDQRWHGAWWINSAFGGLRGSTELWLAIYLLLWLLLGTFARWWRSRHPAPTAATENDNDELEKRFDTRLLTIGLAGIAVALVLPGVYQNTVFFASRWLPMGLIFLILAVPQPPLAKALRLSLPLLLLASLSLATTAAWLIFEARELEGLRASLQGIEEGSNVLGLDFIRTSDVVQGYPYYHLYAWSQAMHGGELARSFANEASSLVVYKDLPRQQPWTPGLDWRASKLRRSDIDHFDYVVVHGDAEMQRLFYADPRLEPATPPKRWSLFRVHAAGAGEKPEPGP